MKNDTIQQIDSLQKDTSAAIYSSDAAGSKDTVPFVDTLHSKDLDQLVTIIKTEYATNSKLTSIVSTLSILITISILINIILLFLLKRNNNRNMENRNMEQTNEKKNDNEDKTVTNKTNDLKELSDNKPCPKQSTNSSTSLVSDERKQTNSRIRLFTETKMDNMLIYGMSMQGTGHIGDNIPCQDCHQVEILNAERNIGIAVVSDGAGSAKNSAEGSKLVCESSIKYLKMAIEKFKWHDLMNLPDEKLWNKVIREVIRLVQIDLNEKAKAMGCELKSLAATFILLYFTPERTFFAHVGDGRAGVKTSDGWMAILTPHKGEEANQTVFVSNEILNPADLRISGVSVPETKVIDKPISAFILMSDGCEDGLWIKNKKETLPDGDFKYVTLNQPFSPAIEKLIQVIQDKRYDKQREEVLFQFMDRYNDNLKAGDDDKTICLGIIEKNSQS